MRLLPIVPSLTELLCDLGLRGHLVGRTKFCVHPADLAGDVPVVGGTKNLRPDAIRALAPTWIIAAKEENDRAQVEALRDLCPVWVADVHDLASAAQLTHDLGRHFGVEARADAVLAANESTLRRLTQPNRGRAVYLIWREPYMSVGGDTYIHSVLERLGYTNACADARRYPTLTPAELTRLAPKHILLSSEPYPFAEVHRAELQRLCPDAAVELVDGELFSWYGSRLGHLEW